MNLYLTERVKPYFENSGSHDFSHTQRVFNNSLKLGETEDVDIDVIKTAALLHDIARDKQARGEVECHAESGAEMAKEILKEKQFLEDKLNNVVHCIKVHRYSKGLKPETKEAEILQDADRLDALGAVCIGRIFEYGGKNNRPAYKHDSEIKKYSHNYESETSFNHFHEKILNITPDSFNTQKARQIAEDRYNFVKEFVNRFEKEQKGER